MTELCTRVFGAGVPLKGQFLPLEKLADLTRGPASAEHTSRKPDMKLFGKLAFGSSSCRKYFMTCVSCFQ